jgi:hypothetical protein
MILAVGSLCNTPKQLNIYIYVFIYVFIHQPAPSRGNTTRFAQLKLYNSFNLNSNKTLEEILYILI